MGKDSDTAEIAPHNQHKRPFAAWSRRFHHFRAIALLSRDDGKFRTISRLTLEGLERHLNADIATLKQKTDRPFEWPPDLTRLHAWQGDVGEAEEQLQ